MDGIDATAKIREMERISKQYQPVVALRAHTMKSDLEVCLSAGMDACLSKPIRSRDLDAVLAQYAVCAPPDLVNIRLTAPRG
jgi:CheY-like chemotaxis protein